MLYLKAEKFQYRRGVKKTIKATLLLNVLCLVAQSCLTLCIPMDCSPLGSSVHGISQARILGGLPFPSPGNLPDPEIEPRFPTLQEDSLPSEPLRKPWNEVGQMIKMKRETKDLGLGNCVEEGVMME